MEELMADVFGGLAQGMAQGMGEIDKTVDYLEQIKQNRDNMRLRMSAEQRAWNQEGRAQDMHQYKMQEMEMQLAKLQDAETRRKMLDEIKGMHNGTRQGFSEELMNSSLYQRTFGNYNVRPASYFGQDVLASMGIENPDEYMLADNGYGEFIPIRKKIFDQTMGYQDELNKYMMADADLLSKQTKAVSDQMVQQNLEELTPIYDQAKSLLEAKIADPNTDPDEIVRLYGALTQLAQYKAGYGMLSGGKGGNIPFAIQESENLKKVYEPFTSLNYTDDDLLLAESYGGKYGTNFYSGISNVMANSINKEMKALGLEVSPAMDVDQLPIEVKRAIKDRANYATKSQLGKKMIENVNELMGNESIAYGMQIAAMAASGQNFKRDAIYKTTNELLKKMPDGVFGDWKNERMTDDQFNVLAQLYINAYGNEKFGSALTETEAGKIDAVFGSGWDNTQKFLKGLKGTMQASYEKMLKMCSGDPLLAASYFGKTFVGMEKALASIEEYEKGLSNYAAWVQKQQKAGKTDLTYKTYEKELNSSPTQMQPLNPSQSTMPEDDEFTRAMKLTEGANLFGGAK